MKNVLEHQCMICFIFVPCHVKICLCGFKPCITLDGEERASCFTLTVFLMSCVSQSFVALCHGAFGWSGLCDCGNSWSYSLVFFLTRLLGYSN